MIDYCDVLMHEYGWWRGYVLWEIAFVTGVKFFSAVYARKTGENLIAKGYQRRLLTALARTQRRA